MAIAKNIDLPAPKNAPGAFVKIVNSANAFLNFIKKTSLNGYDITFVIFTLAQAASPVRDPLYQVGVSVLLLISSLFYNLVLLKRKSHTK